MHRPGSGYSLSMEKLPPSLHRLGVSEDRLRVGGWKLVSTVSGLAAGIVVRKLLNSLWARLPASTHEPPLNPADRRIGWGEALSWSVATGVGVGVARVVSDRLAASTWELATGDPPPGVQAD